MKRIGIGYEFYKEFIDKNLYYVDKTQAIKDLIEIGGKVMLFLRPRRFGKTLFLYMLRTFFEREYDNEGNVIDNSRYFKGMKITDAGEEVLSQMGQYPVIHMSLKSAKQPDFYGAFLALKEEIIKEYDRHSYLLESDLLNDAEKHQFNELLDGEKKTDLNKDVSQYATAIRKLSGYLKKHHGKNVIILLDEYDVPLENAYYAGFYDRMISFIRSLFESALKTNEALERAVITGCLRISRDSIFTGMNNLNIVSIRSTAFSEAFGFTETETISMLAEMGLADKVEEVRNWYDGYLFGDKEIYNPWSVTKYIYEHQANHDALPEPYWSNTSSNSIIKDLIEKADDNTKQELNVLIEGGAIEKRTHEDITYDEIYDSKENLWNFLFFTGYMKKISERADQNRIYLTMKIPNIEIGLIYEDQIKKWFEGIVKERDRKELYRAIKERDCEGIADFMADILDKSISTYDSAESFYHGFFLSLLNGIPRYSARSNREAGDGRPDIILYPNRPADPAYIFEIKIRKKFNEMQDGVQDAIKQIKEKRYEEGIIEEGYAGVVSYGICFCKKACLVKRANAHDRFEEKCNDCNGTH